MAKRRLTEEQKRLLKEVVECFHKEDSATRERIIRTCRRLKLFWENYTQVWYSEVAHDWRIWDQTEQQDNDQAYYDKPVNVFRAYLESIIAALSVTVPPIKCYPDDADDTLDLSTARAGDKIAQLIYRHNDVTLLWLHALFVYCTEGMIACYGYPKADDSYGTYEKKDYEEYDEIHEQMLCSVCGFQIEDKVIDEDIKSDQLDEFMPDDEDVPLNAFLEEGDKEVCPACMALMDPELKRSPFTVTRLVGVTQEPKTRICLEAYGSLNVKIANYARKQSDTPYLIYSYETHYANAIQQYEHLADNKEFIKNIKGNTGPNDAYEQWGRLNPIYQGEYPENQVTMRNVWLRPSAFNVLDDRDAKELKKLFPNGCKVVMVNEEFGEACNESLDDCWTLSFNPMADFLVHDPVGLLLTSIQDITNDLVSLTLQTIEHGIGQTFADPAVLNFPAYEQTEVTPGGVFPATPKSGKSLGDGFHEMKTATLSSEVLPFAQNIQSLGQLVSGALPSLFGGQMEGSETASEYSMSRAQALQRQQNTWKMLTAWWKQIFGKAIPMYIKEVQEDERDVQRKPDGSFINTFIHKAELEGKIGKVELEANENLPMTWAQQKDVIMQLLNAANPEILNIIGAPENLPIMREAIGLVDFYIPDEDEVEDTYDIIKLLVNSEPMPVPIDPMMMEMAAAQGMPPPPTEMSSIEPNPDIDNPEIRFRVTRGWLLSEAGRQARVDNEAGYRNVLLYAKANKMMIMPPTMAPEDGGAPSEGKPDGNKSSTKSAPITGEANVPTVA